MKYSVIFGLTRLAPAALVGALIAFAPTASDATGIAIQTGFEPFEFNVGDLDGQQGWTSKFGPTNAVRIRNDIPRVGAQALYSASGPGVPGTGAYRGLVKDVTDQTVSISSRVTFTSGQRSDWEFNSLFGTAGFIGGLRVLGNNEFVIQTNLGSSATGVLIGGFQVIEVLFDFKDGVISAFRNGAQIGAEVAFDNTNSMLTEVAAFRQITPRADAIALDEFVVNIPEPGALTLIGLGLVGLGLARRRKAGA